MSRHGLALGGRLRQALATCPWPAPRTRPEEDGEPVAACVLFAPARLARHADAPDTTRAFDGLAATLARCYRHYRAHLFIGAAGIAMRALAPLLRHKSLDPPAIVLDPDGRFVISLLSGHWGGGNALTRHLAALLGAVPVITTASDNDMARHADPERQPPALDMLARDAGLRILDWKEVPRIQAALLEGTAARLHDPEHSLPALTPHCLPCRRCPAPAADSPGSGPDNGPDTAPCIVVDWGRHAPAPGLLRLAPMRIHAGLGFRTGVTAEQLEAALERVMAENSIEPQALAGVATVEEKARDRALAALADRLGVPVAAFAAQDLAAVPTPTPSLAAARRFGLAPFSVCEASALLSAGDGGRLLVPKTSVDRRITVALALAGPDTQTENRHD